MKLRFFYVITLTIWSCDSLLDEKGAAVLSHSGGNAIPAAYYVGLNMAHVTDSDQSKDIKLVIHRDSSNNPACVRLRGLTEGSDIQAPLEQSGAGKWFAGDKENPLGIYHRYSNTNTTAGLHLELHWTEGRGESVRGTNMSDPTNRLEYLSAQWTGASNATYVYQSDIDGKLGETQGALSDPQPTFADFTTDTTCGEYGASN